MRPWERPPRKLRIAPVVPPEVCDMILDCLTEDKESLVRCSLVCKNWVPRSRRHLWKRIKLDCAEDNGDQIPPSRTPYRALLPSPLQSRPLSSGASTTIAHASLRMALLSHCSASCRSSGNFSWTKCRSTSSKRGAPGSSSAPRSRDCP